jgi:hypothetical protein
MKKLFLVCLMMLAGSAWAEWVIYDETKEVTFYYDPATIRKDGNMRQVWALLDWRKRDKDGVMSHRLRYEYDCKQERYRFLGISVHTEPMAGGKVLHAEGGSNDWAEIAPETVTEKLLKIVCAK